MKRKDFYELAKYTNETWKGNFAQREILKNAYNYYCDYAWMRKNKTVPLNLQFLIDNLKMDTLSGEDSDKVKYWIKQLQIG